MGWRIVERGAKGGMKGRNRIRNVREVATASRINKERLVRAELVRWEGGSVFERGCVPLLRP